MKTKNNNKLQLVKSVLGGAILAGLSMSSAYADDALTDFLTGGKFTLAERARYEYGKIDGFESSTAITFKTTLGYTSGSFNGFYTGVMLKDVRALDATSYNAAGLNGEAAKTVIADPETTELNHLYLGYKDENVSAKAGRQTYILGNARFVGNVGWRQDEQVYDAVTGSLLAVDGLTLNYGYISDVNRIFAEERDYDSDSHLINLGYKFSPEFSATAYYYLIDLDDAVVTTDTYGVYASGKFAVNDGLSFNYYGEFAMQDRDDDIDTTYYHIVLGTKVDMFDLKVGYEVLGSDDGAGQFLTPLATAHKFNGFADAYLNNGGAGGLSDLYFMAATKIDKLVLKGFFHVFDSDEGSAAEGTEIDFVAVYPLNKYMKLLAKGAFYQGDTIADRNRFIFELQFKY